MYSKFPPVKGIKTIGNWESDKNLDDFLVIAESLRAEGQHSRADVVYYLIERCKMAEKEIEDLKVEIISFGI